MTALAYLAFLLLLGCERGVELWLSRRNARASFARGGVEVGRGHYRVVWSGEAARGRAAAGMYVVRYEAAGLVRTKRLLLVR